MLKLKSKDSAHLAIVTHEHPATFRIDSCKLLEAGKLLLCQGSVELHACWPHSSPPAPSLLLLL